MKIKSNKKTGLIFSLISLLTVFEFLILYPTKAYSSSYIWNSPFDTAIETSSELTENSIDDNSNPLNLDCGSCILVEQSTGQVLYSYNSHEKLKPASVTKLMSIYLIMEAISQGKINYDTPIPCSENAEYLGGTEENFVNMMNEKAKELGMTDTNYKNCHGIDEDDHYTSSSDIATLSCKLLNQYPEVTNYTTIYMDTLRDGKSSLVNTNKLVRNYNGCTGLKTGSTSLALYNLSASATRNDMKLIAVVMKAPTSDLRFKNASSLLDYGFSNFEYKKMINKNDVVKSVKVSKGITPIVNAISENDCGTLISKGNDINIEQNISIQDTISAPIFKGQTIGKITYSLNGNVISECNLIASDNVDKINLFSMCKLILNNWFNLLRT